MTTILHCTSPEFTNPYCLDVSPLFTHFNKPTEMGWDILTSTGSSQLRDGTQVSQTAGRFLTLSIFKLLMVKWEVWKGYNCNTTLQQKYIQSGFQAQKEQRISKLIQIFFFLTLWTSVARSSLQAPFFQISRRGEVIFPTPFRELAVKLTPI